MSTPIPDNLINTAKLFRKIADKMDKIRSEWKTVGSALLKDAKPGRYGIFTVVHVKECEVKRHRRRAYTYVRANR